MPLQILYMILFPVSPPSLAPPPPLCLLSLVYHSAVEQFIRSKYEKKLYMDKDKASVKSPTTSSAKSTRPIQQENKLKVKKSQERKVTPPRNEVLLLPRRCVRV